MASLGWIYFGEAYRNKIAIILDMLKEKRTVDELGIGMVRDVLSDKMFPGISTLHTRAKYFFLTPYILLEYEKSATNLSSSEFLYQWEDEIMWDLGDYYEHEERHGVFGISKRRDKREKLVRRPCVVYWNGMKYYHFIQSRDSNISLSAFLFRQKKSWTEELMSEVRNGDEQRGDDAGECWEGKKGIHVPYREGWREKLKTEGLELTGEEADLFRDRIQHYAKDKVIEALVSDSELWESFKSAGDFSEFARKAKGLQMDGKVREVLVEAHDFSEVFYGAHILYNVLLQKQIGENGFEREWEEWLSGLKGSLSGDHPFDIGKYLDMVPGLRSHTKFFLTNWCAEIFRDNPCRKTLEELVCCQEKKNKRAKARLGKDTNTDVVAGSWLGLRRLDYRFYAAKSIIKDIINPINQHSNA